MIAFKTGAANENHSSLFMLMSKTTVSDAIKHVPVRMWIYSSFVQYVHISFPKKTYKYIHPKHQHTCTFKNCIM